MPATPPADRPGRIDFAFNDLTKDTIDNLDLFYHPEVVFEDPLGQIEGLPALKEYYASMYENVQEIHFDFTNAVVEGDQHVVFWTLRMKVSSLKSGDEVSAIGNSLIRFGENDLVVYHRDFFDMGEFIYQHVPILGFAVRRVNKRLAHGS